MMRMRLKRVLILRFNQPQEKSHKPCIWARASEFFLHDCDDIKHMIVEQNRFLASSITNCRFSLHAIKK